MTKPILAITADTHLDNLVWAYRPQICSDSFHSFSQITTYCQEHDLPLLIAGDVFNHKYPEPEVLKFTLQAIQPLSTVYYLQGQHDTKAIPWLTLAPNTVHLHKLRVDVNSISFYGLDYSPSSRFKQEVKQSPTDVNFLVVHQPWTEFLGKFFTNLNCSEVHQKRVITGDFHSHQIKQLAHTMLISPGSTCIQSTDEELEKCFFLLNDDLTLTSVPLTTRPVHRHYCIQEEDLEQIIPHIKDDPTLPEAIAKPIIIIRCTIDFYTKVQLLMQEYSNKAHFFLSLTGKYKTERDHRSERLFAEAEECLREICTDEQLYQYANRLWQTTDVELEWQKIVKENGLQVNMRK